MLDAQMCYNEWTVERHYDVTHSRNYQVIDMTLSAGHADHVSDLGSALGIYTTQC